MEPHTSLEQLRGRTDGLAQLLDRLEQHHRLDGATAIAECRASLVRALADERASRAGALIRTTG